MGCSGSTSPRAPTSHATAPATWRPSPTRSTPARARRSDGAPRQRCSTRSSPLRPDALRGQRTPNSGRAPAASRAAIAAAASPYGLDLRDDSRAATSPPCALLATVDSPITPVLPRLLESGQYVALGFGQKARDAGIAVSMGS